MKIKDIFKNSVEKHVNRVYKGQNLLSIMDIKFHMKH